MFDLKINHNIASVSGEIDIYCADEFKNIIINEKFKNDFFLDFTKLTYIDSSGIGVLLSIYNYYTDEKIKFIITPSAAVKKIFTTCKLDSIFFKQTSNESLPQSIEFQESFKADTRVLAYLIDKLFDDLKKAKYSEDEAQEIVVAVDEAVTNAILETIKASGDVDDDFSTELRAEILKNTKSIAIRWIITPDDFHATVIDRGGGLDLEQINKEIPQVQDENYLEQVKNYEDNGNIIVRFNGKNIRLKRLGAGLKIMQKFLDAVIIDLIDSKSILSETVSKNTVGTILNLYRKRREDLTA